MPQVGSNRDTHPAPVPGAALAGLIGIHTAAPPRGPRLLRYALPTVLLLGAVAYAAARLWVFAAMFVTLAATLTWGTRSRSEGVCTEVTALGLTIHTRGAHRAIAWGDVQEVYPRASWALFPSLRLASGTTVALPGVSDEQAPRLEHARADHARTMR